MKPYFETALGCLYNMDCLEFMKTMEDKSVDLVLTDPPYGIGIAPEGWVRDGMMAQPKQYDKVNWDSQTPPQECFNEIQRVSKKQIIFGGNYFTDKLPPAKCWICWDKQIPKGFTKAQIELAWTNLTTYSRLYSVLWHGMIRVRDQGQEERHHPTEKPFRLIRQIIRELAKDNEVILDPYLGGGTTAVVCEKLSRKWIGIEISEKYCEIAAKRINSEASQIKLF